jgi:hypothetical protein
MDDVALTLSLIGLSHVHLIRVCVFYGYFTVAPQAFLLIGVVLGSAKVFGSHRIFLGFFWLRFSLCKSYQRES